MSWPGPDCIEETWPLSALSLPFPCDVLPALLRCPPHFARGSPPPPPHLGCGRRCWSLSASVMLACASEMLADQRIGLPPPGSSVQELKGLGPSAFGNLGCFCDVLFHCFFALEMVLDWPFASEMRVVTAHAVGPPRILPENEWRGSSMTTVSYLEYA
jgi:hypothetical protein